MRLRCAERARARPFLRRLDPPPVGGARAGDDSDRALRGRARRAVRGPGARDGVGDLRRCARCAAPIRCGRCTTASSTRSTSWTRSRSRPARVLFVDRVRAGRRSDGGAPDAGRAAVGRPQPPRQRAPEVREPAPRRRAGTRSSRAARWSNLEKQVALKAAAAGARRRTSRRGTRESFDEGVGTWLDASQPEARGRPAGRGSWSRCEPTPTDTRNALARLTFEMASRRAAFAELERGIGEDLSAYRTRKGCSIGMARARATPCRCRRPAPARS